MSTNIVSPHIYLRFNNDVYSSTPSLEPIADGGGVLNPRTITNAADGDFSANFFTPAATDRRLRVLTSDADWDGGVRDILRLDTGEFLLVLAAVNITDITQVQNQSLISVGKTGSGAPANGWTLRGFVSADIVGVKVWGQDGTNAEANVGLQGSGSDIQLKNGYQSIAVEFDMLSNIVTLTNNGDMGLAVSGRIIEDKGSFAANQTNYPALEASADNPPSQSFGLTFFEGMNNDNESIAASLGLGNNIGVMNILVVKFATRPSQVLINRAKEEHARNPDAVPASLGGI